MFSLGVRLFLLELTIFINCVTPINKLKVCVKNMSTGELIVEDYESVYGSIIIPIANLVGYYNIEFVVNDSLLLVGSFEVE